MNENYNQAFIYGSGISNRKNWLDMKYQRPFFTRYTPIEHMKYKGLVDYLFRLQDPYISANINKNVHGLKVFIGPNDDHNTISIKKKLIDRQRNRLEEESFLNLPTINDADYGNSEKFKRQIELEDKVKKNKELQKYYNKRYQERVYQAKNKNFYELLPELNKVDAMRKQKMLPGVKTDSEIILSKMSSNTGKPVNKKTIPQSMLEYAKMRTATSIGQTAFRNARKGGGGGKFKVRVRTDFNEFGNPYNDLYYAERMRRKKELKGEK